jgi:hypothetical protein
MDDETTKALDEVLHILHTTAEGQPSPTVSQETPPMQQPEEEPEVIPPYTHKQPTALDLQAGKANKKGKRIGNQRPWLRYTELAVALIVLTVTGVLVIIPLFEPSATVTIIPAVTTVTTTSTIQVPGRVLAPLTLTQARSDQTTGIGHQEAAAAHGLVTFYNALPQAQTVPAGELLTGNDGVEVVTDQAAYLPAGTLATNGQATVAAHAVIVGPAGNIRGGDIYGACCRENVFAANSPFAGGKVARTFPMVTQSDLDNATKQLHTSLEPGITASLEAELHPGETDTPPACTTQVSSDHTVGEEATKVTTTLTERERYVVEECLAQAYDRAAALLAELGAAHPGLIPLCLVVSIVLTLISEHLFVEEKETR